MLKNKLIILPIDGIWEHSADFLRQTALTLSSNNQIIIYDQNNAYFFLKKIVKINYPSYKNISFHRVKYFLPFRRFVLLEKLNRAFSFWLFLQKYRHMEKIMWIFYPNYFDLAKIKNAKTISLYDCVDYNEFHKKEKSLIDNVDYFFVNSITLKNLHQQASKKPIYINAQGFFVPEEQGVEKIDLKIKKPIIGYVGGINYRLNFQLLDKLIEENPQWQFVFYGPKQKYPKKDLRLKTDFWIKKIESHKNVIFGKSRDRNHVYRVIKNFDVAIIPYDNNLPFNKYCYPMKVFEYLYFQKPIVSSPIRELTSKKFSKFIKIAEKDKDWKKHIQYYLEHQPSIDNLNVGKKLAMTNSWHNKIQKISKLIFFKYN